MTDYKTKEEERQEVKELRIGLHLQTAAAESYRKHCGPNAVACADGDLLGEALRAIRAILEMPIYSSTPSQQRRVDAHREQLKAVLAKAKGEKP